MKKLTMILLTMMVMLSGCSTPIKKLDLTAITFVDYYYGSDSLIPNMEFFPLETNQINPLTPYLDTASWVAIKKPAGTITAVFTLRDFRQREFSFSLKDDKMLVVIKDNQTTYYYQGTKEDYVGLADAIEGFHQTDYVPDLSDLVLNMGLPEGENTLISDMVTLTAEQSTEVLELLNLDSWSVSEVLVPYDYCYELIIRTINYLSIGFRLEGNQEIAVIRDMLSNDYTVYDVPANVKQNVKTLVRSYIVIDHPDGDFLDTLFAQSYIGFGEGFGSAYMIPEYIYTLTDTQAIQLNGMFDLSNWEVLTTIPEIYYFTFGLIDTNGNRFFFTQDGDGTVIKVLYADSTKEPSYYAIRLMTPETIRQNLGDWYVPQKPSAYVRSLDFIKVRSGFDEETASVYLYDLTADQLLEFKEILDFDSWIQSYNIPGMGLNASYMLETNDSISMVITLFGNQAWFLISDQTMESPQILGYFAPASVYNAAVAYLKKNTP